MPTYDDLVSTIAGVRRSNPYDRQRLYAQQMMLSGADYSPVQHPLQGAARLAQALVGGWLGAKADREEETALKKQQDAFATAMSETDPQKRIAMIAAVDPALGARLSGQLAVKQAELEQTMNQRRAGADQWAYGYMGPPGMPSTAVPTALTPLPGGTVTGGNPAFTNNVGNLRASPAAWEGKGVPHNGFETFATPQQGVNAAFKNLEAYARTNPQMTVAQAIAKWAPPNENNTQGYISRLAESTGINPGMPLVEVLRDPAVAATLLDGITRIEKGGLPPGVTADTFMTATGGMAPQQQGVVQAGMPPQPQVPTGPAVVAPPQAPSVPVPPPDPALVARLRGMIAQGSMTPQQAEAIVRDEQVRAQRNEQERAMADYKQRLSTYETSQKPSKAQETVDTEFGKDYAEYIAAGGSADVQRQIVQLQEALKTIRSGATVSGPLTGALGSISTGALSAINPQAVAVRNAIEEVVQRNLRIVLGAQFTEREGERLIQRAFNPYLSAEENGKRVERLLAQIQIAAAAKADAAKHYEQFGTLRGWKGRIPTPADFDPDSLFGKEGARTPQQPQMPSSPQEPRSQGGQTGDQIPVYDMNGRRIR